jgi:hypothetical protein
MRVTGYCLGTQRGIIKSLDMKRVLWLVMGWMGMSGAVRAQDAGFHLEGMVSRSVPVTVSKMTNLVFPVPVASGVKVSRDILAQKPRGVENVIELKAMRRDFLPTNFSVYGKDGALYSFDLRYVEDTAVLNFRVVRDGDLGAVRSSGVGGPVMLTGLPVSGVALDSDAVLLAGRRGFLHGSVASEGVRLRLRGIFLRDSLLWLSLRVTDGTMIAFRPVYVRVFVEDTKRVRRTASQRVEVSPVYTGMLPVVLGGGSGSLVLGLVPFAPGKGKRLVVELADAGGGRDLVLRVKGKRVLRARKVE